MSNSPDIKFILNGDELFENLWERIDNSKCCCWILTYHIVDDFIGNETLLKLIAAAQRGVSVILYSDYLNFRANSQLIEELEQAGGHVRSLNPMNIWMRLVMGLSIFSRDIFERYHQKLFLIDNCVIIGSANLDCAYAGPKHGSSRFYDMNLLLESQCIAEAQNIFSNIAERYDWEIELPYIPEQTDQHMELLVSEPHYLRFDIQERIIQMINRAKSHIVLAHGYYFNIQKITNALKKAVKRGVKVVLLTSESRDQPAYKYFSNSWLTGHLRDFGIKVYEYPGRVLHMKAYIVDDEFIVGSFNNDKWSWGLNNELNLYVKNQKMTEKLFRLIESVKSESKVVTTVPVPFLQMCLTRIWEVFLLLSEITMDRRKYHKLHSVEAFYPDTTQSLSIRYLRHINKLNSESRIAFNSFLIDSYI